MPDPRYVRVVNHCNETIHISFAKHSRPKKGKQHGLKPATLRPKKSYGPVLYDVLANSDTWDELSRTECVSILTENNVAPWIGVRNRTKKKIHLPVRVRVRLKPGKRLTVQTKRIGLEPHQTRAFTESALKRQPEILDLAKRNVIKMSPIVFALPPAPSSYGYDEGFYVCDECGGPIIFRYSPPRPIHV